MNRADTTLSPDPHDEIAALIETLHRTEQRLEELTADGSDTAANRKGRASVLRHAQDRWRRDEAAKQTAILNALPAHIALLDDHGRIIAVNEAWRRFGVENSLNVDGSGVGLNYFDVCAAAQRTDAPEAQRVAAGIRSVLNRATKEFSIEYASHSPTEQRWFLMTVAPLAADRRNGAVIMHLDITAERQNEETLRVSESRFRQMAESITDVFFLQNLDGSQFYYVSPAYEQIWGRTRASLYADPQSWAEAIHPEDLDPVSTGLNAGLNIAMDHEYRIVRPDGEVRWIRARAFPILDAAGMPFRMAGVASDITERKESEVALREREAEFRTLAESIPQIVWIASADGSDIYFNQQWIDYTGLTLEDSLGDGWLKPFHPDDRQRALDAWRKAAATAGAYSLEARMRRADGAYRWWLVRAVPMRDAEGEASKWFGTSTDIHDLKMAGLEISRRNRELRENEIRISRLNRVYALLSELNSLIVHAGDPDELYNGACRIAVERGGFRMAMIAIADPDASRIVPVASAGKNDGLMAAIKRRLSSSETAADTMVARAIREKRAVVSNDSQSDPALRFPAEYAQSGVRSIAVMPLLVADRAVGVFALYAAESEFFHEEEMKLLGELAGDVAFAIDHLDRQKQLDYLAWYDALTGLANRGLFLDRVAQYVRSALSGEHKLAVLLIDLERFKNINDSLGRAAGDALLKQVAEWLTRNAGDANVIARLGADHFAVVLPEVRQNTDAARQIEKLMADFLEHPFRLGEATFRIAIRVGAALFPDDGEDADVVFRNAEAALKKAKASGDRYLFYTQKMTESMVERLGLETQLREALDKGEFVLHYQPKVNLATGKLAGVEALIRWNDPRTGLVPPGRFIPVLEEIGLIHDVGRWALRQALADHLRWQDHGLPAAVRMAVNVSPLQLRHRGFIAEIEQVTGVDARAPAGLELELTESLIMEDVQHSIVTLEAIRALGVTVAIDDFGTGFSSLSYLSRLPVDTLKIDRSFVVDMTVAPEGLALVSTIINLAHSLNLNVVAEGVETEEQSRLLHLLNCDETQGYLFCRPVPAEQFEARFLAPPPAA
ncbi:MAG: EAL domain-containing protein [Betaproteobacteria bacterium]|nr:EAL domain-containing protein [Betaproteobacteria bacterium]